MAPSVAPSLLNIAKRDPETNEIHILSNVLRDARIKNNRYDHSAILEAAHIHKNINSYYYLSINNRCANRL